MTPDPAGHRRRPAWLPTVAAFATVILCVMAGNWQHRRMLEKEALQERMHAAAALPPVALPADVADWMPWRFRQVIVTGRYDAPRQILIDNKVHAGRAGYDVVTPLRLDDGRVVLVDRGWIGVGATRAVLPGVPPAQGTTTLRGRIDIPPRDYYELGERKAPSGPLWQHLDPARFAQATGVSVLPIVIDALDATDGGQLVRDWPMPDAGIDTHLSYMIQWYVFAAMAAGLWLWFTFRPKPVPAGARRRSADDGVHG
jgi:surfeit locus 1 family protein